MVKEFDLDKVEYVIEHLRNPERLLENDFQEWLTEDENFQVFDEICRNREAWIYRDFVSRIDESEELKKCLARIRSRRRIYYWLSAAACMILLFTSSLFFTADREIVPETELVQGKLVGKKCAELILANGKRMVLDNNPMEIRDVQGSVVINDTLSRLMYQETEEMNTDSVVEYHTLKVPSGADYYVQLGDGTKIWLNCESTLRYPVNFSKNERKVFLDGEAYFEVKKSERWPFIVTTDKMDVRVTGTTFNVKSYAHEAVIHTTLVEGIVFVNEQRLHPAQQFVMNKETQEIDIKNVDTEIYTGWVEGMFVFKNQRLENVMSDLARWYKVEVFYMNPSTKDIRFSGNLGRYETIDDLLQIIEAIDKVSIVRKGNTITISTK